MLRTTILLALCAAPFAALAQLTPSQPIFIGPPIIAPAPCANVFDQEPLLMYDVSGYGLAGLIHQHMCVYDNGLVTIGAAGGGTPLFPFGSAADITYLPVEKVKAFYKDVMLAGAFSICDEDAFVADAPLTTVTIFRGDTEAKAHTYSYWYPISTENENVHALIYDFLHATFPNF